MTQYVIIVRTRGWNGEKFRPLLRKVTKVTKCFVFTETSYSCNERYDKNLFKFKFFDDEVIAQEYFTKFREVHGCVDAEAAYQEYKRMSERADSLVADAVKEWDDVS